MIDHTQVETFLVPYSRFALHRAGPRAGERCVMATRSGCKWQHQFPGNREQSLLCFYINHTLSAKWILTEMMREFRQATRQSQLPSKPWEHLPWVWIPALPTHHHRQLIIEEPLRFRSFTPLIHGTWRLKAVILSSRNQLWLFIFSEGLYFLRRWWKNTLGSSLFTSVASAVPNFHYFIW